MGRTRSVIISGGAGDIGSAIGAELARRGDRITVLDAAAPDDVGDVLDRLRAASQQPVAYVQADVRDRAAVDAAIAANGDIDVVIAAAAIAGSHPFLELTSETWEQTIAVNLTGCFNVGQSAARAMRASGVAGRIVFIGSWVQAIPWPDITAYTVSKAGVEMLARQMARELASSGIRVNVVAPGIVDAGLAKRQREDDPLYAQRVAKVIPLGELQTAEQVAKVTAFLCSDDADYITGATLLADGGCSLFQFDAGLA